MQERDQVSMDEIDGEDAVNLPNKEVLSLLDVNANVDLGLDLAAPVDLAAAANLNVAAPIEAAATANVLSEGAQAVGLRGAARNGRPAAQRQRERGGATARVGRSDVGQRRHRAAPSRRARATAPRARRSTRLRPHPSSRL